MPAPMAFWANRTGMLHLSETRADDYCCCQYSFIILQVRMLEMPVLHNTEELLFATT